MNTLIQTPHRCRVFFSETHIVLETNGLDPHAAKEVLNAESARYGLGFACTELNGRLLVHVGRHTYRLNQRNRVKIGRQL